MGLQKNLRHSFSRDPIKKRNYSFSHPTCIIYALSTIQLLFCYKLSFSLQNQIFIEKIYVNACAADLSEGFGLGLDLKKLLSDYFRKNMVYRVTETF